MFDDETVNIYREYVNLHYALLPYLHEQGAIAFSQGRSLFTFTDSDRYSYLLGDDIFVAPILQENGEVSILFPQGDWVYLFDQEQNYSGGESITLQLPLAEFSVFVRKDSPVAETLLNR